MPTEEKRNLYVKCGTCGGKIYFGEEAYLRNDFGGVYCCAECFTEAHANIQPLDEELASNHYCAVYDDRAIEKRADEIREQIAKLQEELSKLYTSR